MGRLILLSVAVAPLLLLLGCSEGSESGVAGQRVSESGLEDGGSEATDILRVTRLERPIETESLSVLVLGEAPESVNPWRDPSDLELLLFPRAIRRSPESLEWEPWMAESWEFSEERRSVEVTIRDGASWSDDTPVRAADWVTVANRYFGDPALRTPYRERPELQGLDPRWEEVGELRFRITVRHSVDQSTLLSLLYLPPLPARLFAGAAQEPLSGPGINALWRLPPRDSGPRGGAESADAWSVGLGAVPSAGPYELESIETAAAVLTLRLERRDSYRDPSYDTPASKTVEIRYGSESSIRDGRVEGEPEDGSGGIVAVLEEETDLIYLPHNRVPGVQPVASPPPNYRTLSAGTDLTPALLLVAPALDERAELLAIAREAKRSFLAELLAPGVVRRDLPSVGDLSVLFSSGETPQPSEAAQENESEGSITGLEETAKSLRFLVLDRPLHRGYAEALLLSARRQGVDLAPQYVSREEIAGTLLTDESWELILLESRESFDPLLGDPLLGNALPLTGEWALLASATPARSVVTEPLSPAELSALRGGGLTLPELPELLSRLWRNVAASPREADRQRAGNVLAELWEIEPPWLYLFDEERFHYAQNDLGNLIFRHLPGAELGAVLPRIYRENGGVR